MISSASESVESSVAELRIALVLNGGVSLAVWMGGSARELHAAVTSTPTQGEPVEGDSVEQLWGKLLEKARLRLSVDVIAGTSAGGLNGTLMASCLALGTPYPDMESEWHNLPRLARGALLRMEDVEASGLSILDGSYFSAEVTRLFNELEKAGDETRSRDVSCLVTATAIGGTPRVVQDDFGAQQTVSDHRRVYRFLKQRVRYEYVDDEQSWLPASINDFTDSGTVASAARASSAFPFAFEPVVESTSLQRKRKIGQGGQTWLMDGGVLDNAAFEPLLDAIRDRPVDGPWQRVVAYLVPQGGGDAHAGQLDVEPPMPSIPEILGSVVSSWRETDSRLDLDALEDYRRQAGNAATTPHSLLAKARLDRQDPAPKWLKAASGLFGLYVATRVGAVVRRDALPADDFHTAYIQRPEGEGSALKARVASLPFIPDRLAAPRGNWRWGIGTALRVLRWWARDLNELPSPDDRVLAHLGQLQAYLQAVAETAEAVRTEVANRPRIGMDAGLNGLATRLEVLEEWSADPRVMRCFEMAGQLVHSGAEAYAGVIGVRPSWAVGVALRVEVLLHATIWEDAIPDRPPLKFLRMGPDMSSPAAPKAILDKADWGSRKLYGTTLGHFGAFADGDWRRSDWIWGRLDAAAHLVSLLASLGKTGAVDIDTWTARLQTAILADEHTDMQRWHREALRVSAHGGLDNRFVIDHMRRSDFGQTSLKGLADEALSTLARVGKSRPGRSAEATEFLREALYLEKPLPAGLDSISKARAAGLFFRHRIREWIKNTNDEN